VRLLDAAVLGFAAAAAPGPFQALLLERSARQGVRRALPLSLVPLVSDPPVVAACLFALAGVPAPLLRVLGGAGGLLLLWMGLATLRRLAGTSETAPRARAVDGFWGAALVNLLNPNVWIFWSLVGGPLLAQAAHASAGEAAIFLAGFYAPLTATNAALVAGFGALGRLGSRARLALAALSGVAFLGLGGLQLWRALLGG
jgi:threonine/homoserine/homoserine lactone efflux protein